jgi:hypothetical protein
MIQRESPLAVAEWVARKSTCSCGRSAASAPPSRSVVSLALPAVRGQDHINEDYVGVMLGDLAERAARGSVIAWPMA